jgi:hypothetical protein
MINIKNGWLQYDNQIGTFRGERNGVVYGAFTGEFSTAEDLLIAMDVTLTEQELIDLKAEKGETWQQ